LHWCEIIFNDAIVVLALRRRVWWHRADQFGLNTHDLGGLINFFEQSALNLNSTLLIKK
jgi:hypothetical protein